MIIRVKCWAQSSCWCICSFVSSVIKSPNHFGLFHCDFNDKKIKLSNQYNEMLSQKSSKQCFVWAIQQATFWFMADLLRQHDPTFLFYLFIFYFAIQGMYYSDSNVKIRKYYSLKQYFRLHFSSAHSFLHKRATSWLTEDNQDDRTIPFFIQGEFHHYLNQS